MENLKGKKLLVISSDSSDRSFVKAAKEMGIYVVCCDRYKDWKISPAKLMADEAWDIDYTDIDNVVKKCKEIGIDGVIAGYSEDRVAAACKIANRLGTPFYATEEQINFTRNKKKFKETCKKCGVSVPTDYCYTLPLSTEDRNKIVYPVIIKPSDNGGRKGISVCTCESELDDAIEYAKENSKNGEIVIEEYLVGTEMSAIYTISNGVASLSCVNDKYNSEEQEGFSRLCDLVLTPSNYYDLYIETVDAGIKKLLKEIGAENGVANFQFMVANGCIKAFEMGYRVNGNDDFKVIRKSNDIDFLKMLIHYSITGNMGDNLDKDNPLFDKYYCTLCMYLHGGTIKTVEYEDIKKIENIYDISLLRGVGKNIIENGTTAQKAMVIKMAAETKEEIIDLIHLVQDNVRFIDEDGKNMLLKPFDTNRLVN